MSVPDTPSPSLSLRLAAFAGLAVILAASVFGAYNGLAPGAVVADDAPAPFTLMGAPKSVQAGNAVTYYVALADGAPNETVNLRAVAADTGLTVTPPTVVRDANGRAIAPVRVSVAEDAAPGQRLFTLGLGGRILSIPVTVLAERAAPDAGTPYLAEYVFRTEDGKLITSNVADIVASPIPKDARFFQPPYFTPFPSYQGDDRWGLEILTSTLDDMQDGESRFLTISTEQGFKEWNPWDPLPRTATVSRVHRWTNPIDLPRSTLTVFFNVPTSQAQNLSAGDEITLPLYGMQVPFEVTNAVNNTLTLRVDAPSGTVFSQNAFLPVGATDIGQAVTFPGFPGGTTVLTFTDNYAVFTATPPLNTTFTGRAGWTNASSVTAMDDTSFTVTHSPAAGTTWSERSENSQTGAAVTYRVSGLTDTTVEREYRSDDPLAARILHVDLNRYASS